MRSKPTFTRIVGLAIALLGNVAAVAYEPKTLEIGALAPTFDLLGTDGKHHKLADFADKSVLVVIFTTNHCPNAIASYGGLGLFAMKINPRGVAFVPTI